jgi:hypothetical protein
MRLSWESLWRSRLGRTSSRTTWLAIHATSPWSPTQKPSINLPRYACYPVYAPLPFVPSLCSFGSVAAGTYYLSGYMYDFAVGRAIYSNLTTSIVIS